MRRGLFELVFLLVIIGTGAWFYFQDLPSEQPPLDFEQTMKRAWEAIEANDLKKAEQELLEAARLENALSGGDSRLAEVFDDLGLVYFKQGRLDRAEHFQTRAVGEALMATGVRGEMVQLYCDRLSIIYMRQGQEGALRALKSDPFNVFETGIIPQTPRVQDYLKSRQS